MVHYLLYDAAGNIVQAGHCERSCLDLQCPDDLQLLEIAQPLLPVDLIHYGVFNGAVVRRDIGRDQLQQVMSARQIAYPPLQDFADAMFWHSRGDDSKLKDYYAKCEAVKQAHPKP